MSGLLPEADGRLRLVFDLTGMGQHYNGTNEHTLAVLRPLVERWRSRFRIAGVASNEVFRFHGSGPDRRTSSAKIRLLRGPRDRDPDGAAV